MGSLRGALRAACDSGALQFQFVLRRGAEKTMSKKSRIFLEFKTFVTIVDG